MVDNFKVGSDYNYVGTVEHNNSYLIFSLLLAFMLGALLGSMIASATVASVKEHYCTRYTDTQEYIACKNKPIQEIAESKKGRDKKEQIVDLILAKAKLPIVLKPFKGLIKRAILKKIDEILHNIFGKGFELLG